jgi:hypothetical protein
MYRTALGRARAAALVLVMLLAFTATPAVVESHAQTHVGSATG